MDSAEGTVGIRLTLTATLARVALLLMDDPTRPLRPISHPATSADHYRAPRSKLATPVTALVFATAVAVVGGGTWVALRSDRSPTDSVSSSGSVMQRPSGAATPASTTQFDDQTGQIAFSQRRGQGTLSIDSHTWRSGAAGVPGTPDRIRIAITITCDQGSVSYDPYSFEAFDGHGDLYEASAEQSRATEADLLGSGIVPAGESVSGVVVIDIPQGTVTLLMLDRYSDAVTALKVPNT